MKEGAKIGEQQTVMAESSTEGFEVWLESMRQQYLKLSDNEKNVTLDNLIDLSGASQLHYLSAKVDALFYRDFLKFLPPELREHLLAFLDVKTLLICCCVCRTWNQIVSSSANAWHRACHDYGLVVDREIYNGGHYWKSYLLSMNRRRQQMKTYKCFTSKVYEKYLRRVTAVYYYKGKLAAATESKNICMWDCNTDQCILMLRTDASVCSLKFDEHYLIASTYIGHLVSWDVDYGERLMEYVRHAGAVFTFDYSSHLDLIVSGSSDFKIKIWSLSDAILYRTIHDHECWVLKIVLKPHPAEEGSIHQEQHILFTMDKVKIVVRFMSFVSNKEVPRGMYLSSIYSIPVHNSDFSFYTPGLHFDGIHLYFICQHQNPGQVSNLYKWNVQQKRMESETAINQNVKVFLGVGEKYIAMVTPWRSSISPTFVVIDKETLEEVAFWPLPPSKSASPDCCQIALGESDWLNGLDGRNDHGVLLAAGLEDNTVYVVKWVPRNFEDNT